VKWVAWSATRAFLSRTRIPAALRDDVSSWRSMRGWQNSGAAWRPISHGQTLLRDLSTFRHRERADLSSYAPLLLPGITTSRHPIARSTAVYTNTPCRRLPRAPAAGGDVRRKRLVEVAARETGKDAGLMFRRQNFIRASRRPPVINDLRRRQLRWAPRQGAVDGTTGARRTQAASAKKGV